ncbi:50S ribosomal protein L15e [Candidatus Pacearchaeota archaeon]|nr:50S ribosomal protein L15e [Candidatus Pacearchaeota archaeon]
MGIYKHLHNSFKENQDKSKLILWRKQDAVKKIENPSNLRRAHTLGYKAKQGFILARTRIKKGGRRRQSLRRGRKPTGFGVFFTTKQNKQAIAEKRAVRKFPNLEVLNSYKVGEDGKYHFFEVIMVDKNHSVIKKDRSINWIVSQRRRAFRGLTSAGKKSRGL